MNFFSLTFVTETGKLVSLKSDKVWPTVEGRYLDAEIVELMRSERDLDPSARPESE
jgi:hypothetical protein